MPNPQQVEFGLLYLLVQPQTDLIPASEPHTRQFHKLLSCQRSSSDTVSIHAWQLVVHGVKQHPQSVPTCLYVSLSTCVFLLNIKTVGRSLVHCCTYNGKPGCYILAISVQICKIVNSVLFFCHKS